MPRVLLASFLGIAALFGASIFAIARSTSSERPNVSAPGTDAAPGHVAQGSPPVSTWAAPPIAAPSAPVTVAAATSRAPAPSPSALAERARAENLSARRLGVSSSRSAPGATRLVMSWRDRRLSIAHPELLAQARSKSAAAVMTPEVQSPIANPPCVAGSECDAAQDVAATAEAIPADLVEDEVPVSQ